MFNYVNNSTETNISKMIDTFPSDIFTDNLSNSPKILNESIYVNTLCQKLVACLL